MAEGPFCQSKGRQSWEEYLYCKILEICIETIFTYPSAQTIGALCDYSVPWSEETSVKAHCVSNATKIIPRPKDVIGIFQDQICHKM
jgi:hypothetical protein